MTHDLLKLAEECEKREVHFKQWNDTLNEAELFHKLAAALREAHAEIEKAHAIFGPDTTIEMLEEGLEARAELPKLRAELDAANALVKRHEAALGAVWGDAHNWEFTWKHDCGTGVRTFGINTRARFDQWVIRNGFDTPLAAIEAVTKEESNGNG